MKRGDISVSVPSLPLAEEPEGDFPENKEDAEPNIPDCPALGGRASLLEPLVPSDLELYPANSLLPTPTWEE